RDIFAVSNTLRTGNIAQGCVVEKFEQELANYIGLKGGVATSSGTAALHLALLALGITKNDIVAIPSYVCTAVLNAVNYVGATPLLIDIDPDTFSVAPSGLVIFVSLTRGFTLSICFLPFGPVVERRGSSLYTKSRRRLNLMYRNFKLL
ncbi:MAG: DegT/DnrJ/EryC1/StrS family aminotransferase, partial [Planctomycetota bacterium]